MRTTKKMPSLALPLVLLAGCGSSETFELGETRLGLTVALAESFDVEAVLFEVTGMGMSKSATVALETEGLPAVVDPDLEGLRFADWFVVLPPGVYRVRAVPLSSDGVPSEVCGEATGEADVQAGMTEELILVSRCGGAANGALDTILVLKPFPLIDNLRLEPSKFVCTEEVVVLTATASDPTNGDVALNFEVIGLPEGASQDSFTLASTAGGTAQFSATVSGQYTLQLTAASTSGSETLTFPVYVSDCGTSAELPDLIPMPLEGVPGPIGFCRFDDGGGLSVRVGNPGAGDAGPSTVRVTFSTSNGDVEVLETTGPRASGMRDDVGPFPFPSSCFIPDCFFTIEVDANEEVMESNEENNTASGFCLG